MHPPSYAPLPFKPFVSAGAQRPARTVSTPDPIAGTIPPNAAIGPTGTRRPDPPAPLVAPSPSVAPPAQQPMRPVVATPGLAPAQLQHPMTPSSAPPSAAAPPPVARVKPAGAAAPNEELWLARLGLTPWGWLEAPLEARRARVLDAAAAGGAALDAATLDAIVTAVTMYARAVTGQLAAPGAPALVAPAGDAVEGFPWVTVVVAFIVGFGGAYAARRYVFKR
jgi:hypothetical protein